MKKILIYIGFLLMKSSKADVFDAITNRNGGLKCNIPGGCTLDYTHSWTVVNEAECNRRCNSHEKCEWYTYFVLSNLCAIFSNSNCEPTIARCENKNDGCFSGQNGCIPKNVCNVPGFCVGEVLTISKPSSQTKCLNQCKSNEECRWWSYSTSDDNSCSLFRNCDKFSNTKGDWISGEKYCREEVVDTTTSPSEGLKCNIPGGCTLDYTHSWTAAIEAECNRRCNSHEKCEWYTYFVNSNVCAIFSNPNCEPTIARCDNKKDGCFSGQNGCIPKNKCNVPGLCLEEILTTSKTSSQTECLSQCKSNEDCKWWSYSPSDNMSCSLFRKCENFSASKGDWISGEKYCREEVVDTTASRNGGLKCNILGGCTSGYTHSWIAENEAECIRRCNSHEKCQWYTYFELSNVCAIFSNSDCEPTIARCENKKNGCFSGQNGCMPKNVCNINGLCLGEPVSKSKTSTQTECLSLCKMNDECRWMSYSPSDVNSCMLFRKCDGIDNPKGDWTSGERYCPEQVMLVQSDQVKGRSNHESKKCNKKKQQLILNLSPDYSIFDFDVKKDLQCNVTGGCTVGQKIIFKLSSYWDCMDECNRDAECVWFTFYYGDQTCAHFKEECTPAESACGNGTCLSGQHGCIPANICNYDGLCQGDLFSVGKEPYIEDCIEKCVEEPECRYYSYDDQPKSHICVIMTKCFSLSPGYDHAKWSTSEPACYPSSYVRVLVAMGKDKDGKLLDSVEIFNIGPGRMKCEDFPNFPYPNSEVAGGLGFQNKPIICGGSKKGTTCHRLEDGAWKEFNEMTAPRKSFTVSRSPFSNGGFSLLAIGGEGQNSIDLLVDDKWIHTIPLPNSLKELRGHCVVKLSKTKIFIIGGTVGSESTEGSAKEKLSQKTYILDSAANEKWSEGPQLPAPLTNMSCGTVRRSNTLTNRMLVVAGGSNGANIVKQTLFMDIGGTEWRVGHDLPVGIAGGVLVQRREGGVALIGGATEAGVYDKVLVLTTSEYPAWREMIVQMKIPRVGHTAFLIPSYMTECNFVD